MNLNDSARGKALLADKISGKITLEEFYKQCVLWELEPECWNEIQVKFFTPPPPEWTQYESLDLREKAKIDPSFFRMPVIYNYLKSRENVISWNMGLFGWLGDAIQWLPDTKEYLDQQMTLQKKRFEFKKWIDANLPKFAAEEQERSYEQPKYEGDAQAVSDILGGSFV